MKPMPFTFHRPASLSEALSLLSRLGPEAKVMAGGQSLVPAMNLRLAGPSELIDISALPELLGVERAPGEIWIGAAVPYAVLLADPVLADLPLLAKSLPHVANSAVRNRGTLGGSLCHADPSAETAGALLALGAELEIIGEAGKRRLAVDTFVQGVYETALAPDEILARLILPVPAPDFTWFGEHVRRRGDFAEAGLAMAAQMTRGRLSQCRLAFIGLGTRAVLARATAQGLDGVPLGSETVAAAVQGLAHDLDQADPGCVDDPYKLALAQGLLERALAAARAETEAQDA